MMSMEPQLATAQDIPSIISLFQAGFDDPYFHALFPPNEFGVRYLERTFASFVADGSPGLLHVIRDGDDDAGRVKAWVLHFDEGIIEHGARWPRFEGEGLDKEKMTEFFRGMDEQHKAAMGSTEHVYLELIVTHPEHRGRGLASRLIQHVIGAAGARPIYLDAAGDTVSLYEKLGFRKVGEGLRTSEVMEPMVRPGNVD